MKQIFISSLLSMLFVLHVSSQTRQNTPDMVFHEEPIGSIREGLTGWTYSLDGKWFSGEQVIYPRIQSRNTGILKDPPYKFGIDNIDQLVLHEIVYGSDTIVLLVKFFNNGYFKYPRTQSGWKNEQGLHYFVLQKPTKKLSEISDTTRQTFTMKLINSGTITDVSQRKYLERIEERINLEEKTNRFLYFDFELYAQSDIIRFMLYANHEIFHDLTGTVTDLEIKGKSLFGNTQLLDYVYFETTFTAFSQLKLF